VWGLKYDAERPETRTNRTWPMLTWSFGWTGVFEPSWPPSISIARFAITSLMFMFVWVPEPVCHTTNGKWSSNSPEITCQQHVAKYSECRQNFRIYVQSFRTQTTIHTLTQFVGTCCTTSEMTYIVSGGALSPTHSPTCKYKSFPQEPMQTAAWNWLRKFSCSS